MRLSALRTARQAERACEPAEAVFARMAPFGELPIAIFGDRADEPFLRPIDGLVKIAVLFANLDVVALRQLEMHVASKAKLTVAHMIELNFHADRPNTSVPFDRADQMAFDMGAKCLGELEVTSGKVQVHDFVLCLEPSKVCHVHEN
jgi:hypothetical protein